MRGTRATPTPLSGADRMQCRLAAYHEAGHAVVGLLHGWRILRVTVVRDHPGNGRVLYNPRSVDSLAPAAGVSTAVASQAIIRAQGHIRMLLAGPLAEAKLLGTPLRSLGARRDLDTVLCLLELLRANNEVTVVDPASAADPVGALGRRLRRQTRQLLGQRRVWHAVNTVAEALLSWETLEGDDVMETVSWALGPDRQRLLV